MFSSTPEWGIDVGISINDPSSSVGMNSWPLFRQMSTPQTSKANGTDMNSSRWLRHHRRMRS